MEPKDLEMKPHEQDPPTHESHLLTGVLDHSKNLVDRLVGMAGEKGWLDNGLDASPNFFRAIDEEAGKRRLFVCCDGTWVNAAGSTAPLTNVARFARAIDRVGPNPDYPANPVTQVIYYSAGIGSEPVLKTRVDSIYSGITGAGLEQDILNAYCFLCNNYNFAARHDEIILIGFSRGGFTVRCLADFISQVGLMQRKTLPFLSVVFQRWMDAKEDVNREKMKLQIVGLHPTFSLPVKIKVLAEWDTVSAIGHVGLRKKFSFMKDKVPENVENAFLAIALNERRGSFKPMAYTKAHRGTNVAQCAFSGCHSDIGGGNIDAGLSTVSLLWMTAKVQDACQASLDRGVLLQMVQPPRPSKKWWYGWKTDETAALNLLWSKGNISESLQGVWYIPHVLTLGWSSGWRRRYFRKTFQRQGRNGRKEQDEQHEMTAQHIQRQVAHPAKLHAATYDYANPEDVIKRVSEDVMVKIREGINRAGEESKIEDTDLLSATVKTAIHVNNTKTEAKVTAMVDAAFATYSERGGAAAYWHRTKEARNPQLESGHQKNEIAPGDVDCKLRIHFTVKELVKEPRYRSKEGTLEGLSARLGWLGYERVQPGDYFSQECYNGSERRLWEEWKRQVDMWHTSNQGRKGGWDDDVMYWRDVLARFDKGKKPGSLAQKDMVRWESCANQLRRLADAAAATAQAGLRITAENVTEARADLEFMTRMVTMAVEVAEQLQDHEDITLQKLWSAINEAKEVFNRVSGSKMMGPSAFSLVDVTQTAAGADGNSGLDQKDSLEMDTQKDAQVAIRAVTGQLAGIAGLLAQTLSPFSPTFSPPTPLALSARATPPYIDGKNTDDGDYGWRVGILNAKDAADRMVESAKALQNGDRLDVAAWKTTKDYATRAKEAAEEAAKAIRDATIQWKVTDEQRSEALCYRIAYPDLESTIGSIQTCA